jgi:hypothetical protein
MKYALMTVLVPFEGGDFPKPEDVIAHPGAHLVCALIASVENHQNVMDAARECGRMHCRALPPENSDAKVD